MRSIHLGILTMVLLACVSPAYASIIFDNGGPNANGGAVISNFPFPAQAGEIFSVPSAVAVNTVTWWGSYGSGSGTKVKVAPDDFTIRFFENAGGNPPQPMVNPLHEFAIGNVTATDTGIDSFGWDVYHYSATIPSTSLNSGTHFISIVNDITTNQNIWWWHRANRFQGHRWNRSSDGGAWTTIEPSVGPNSGTQFAFNLAFEPVPEPSSLVLLCIAAIGVAGFTWRRQQRIQTV